MSIPFTWIYLVYDPFTGYFKIGKSDKPDERVKQLCNPKNYGTIPAAPTNYRLLEAWLCPEAWEADLHKVFDENRIHGEWFDLYKHYGIDPEECTCLDVEFRFERSVMSDQLRWGDRFTDRREQLDCAHDEIMRLRALLEASTRQLSRAKLLGFEPVDLLLPAPVIDPTSDWPDVVAEKCDSTGAAGVDLLQETGDIAF